VVRYFDHHFPSLSLMIAAKSLNLGPGPEYMQDPARPVRSALVGAASAPIPSSRCTPISIANRDDRAGVPRRLVLRRLQRQDSAYQYTDKIFVLNRRHRAGIGTVPGDPLVSAATPSAVALAHAVSSILQEHFFVVPPLGSAAELLVIALVAAYLSCCCRGSVPARRWRSRAPYLPGCWAALRR